MPYKSRWVCPQIHRQLDGKKGICRRDDLEEILGEVMLGTELLSAGAGLPNATQSWQGDRLAAGAAETPCLSGSWSWTVRPQVQPHSTVPWQAARTAAQRAAVPRSRVPRSRVSALQALLPASDGSRTTFS